MSNIILTSNIINSEYTEYLYEKFDIQNREQTTTIVPMINEKELESFEWNIGIILGNSGSGKSTVLNKLRIGTTEMAYNYEKPIIAQFPNKSPEEVCELYFGIGLSSIPTLLRRVGQLSNVEFARFELAWKIGTAKDGDTIFIDEFTSVVNRDVAKSMSFALQRYIRKHNLHIILASCHFDIIEWLQPDWVFNLNKQKNNECEIEHFIYAGPQPYEEYNKLDEKEILSDAKPINI